MNISCYLESVYEICFLGWAQWNSVINKEGGFLGEKLQRYQGEKRGAKWVKGGAKNKELWEFWGRKIRTYDNFFGFFWIFWKICVKIGLFRTGSSSAWPIFVNFWRFLSISDIDFWIFLNISEDFWQKVNCANFRRRVGGPEFWRGFKATKRLKSRKDEEEYLNTKNAKVREGHEEEFWQDNPPRADGEALLFLATEFIDVSKNFFITNLTNHTNNFIMPAVQMRRRARRPRYKARCRRYNKVLYI